MDQFTVNFSLRVLRSVCNIIVTGITQAQLTTLPGTRSIAGANIALVLLMSTLSAIPMGIFADIGQKAMEELMIYYELPILALSVGEAILCAMHFSSTHKVLDNYYDIRDPYNQVLASSALSVISVASSACLLVFCFAILKGKSVLPAVEKALVPVLGDEAASELVRSSAYTSQQNLGTNAIATRQSITPAQPSAAKIQASAGGTPRGSTNVASNTDEADHIGGNGTIPSVISSDQDSGIGEPAIPATVWSRYAASARPPAAAQGRNSGI